MFPAFNSALYFHLTIMLLRGTAFHGQPLFHTSMCTRLATSTAAAALLPLPMHDYHLGHAWYVCSAVHHFCQFALARVLH